MKLTFFFTTSSRGDPFEAVSGLTSQTSTHRANTETTIYIQSTPTTKPEVPSFRGGGATKVRSHYFNPSKQTVSNGRQERLCGGGHERLRLPIMRGVAATLSLR